MSDLGLRWMKLGMECPDCVGTRLVHVDRRGLIFKCAHRGGEPHVHLGDRPEPDRSGIHYFAGVTPEELLSTLSWASSYRLSSADFLPMVHRLQAKIALVTPEAIELMTPGGPIEIVSDLTMEAGSFRISESAEVPAAEPARG